MYRAGGVLLGGLSRERGGGARREFDSSDVRAASVPEPADIDLDTIEERGDVTRSLSRKLKSIPFSNSN